MIVATNPSEIRNPPNAVLGPQGPKPDANVSANATTPIPNDAAPYLAKPFNAVILAEVSPRATPYSDRSSSRDHVGLCATHDKVFNLRVRAQRIDRTPDHFHKHSAPLLPASRARSKSFPAQSNSYKAVTARHLYFEQLTDGTPDAYNRPDEVARNGAFQG
jgi:hypothetical protein